MVGLLWVAWRRLRPSFKRGPSEKAYLQDTKNSPPQRGLFLIRELRMTRSQTLKLAIASRQPIARLTIISDSQSLRWIAEHLVLAIGIF